MNYKWDADEYSKNSENQKRWADGLLNRINFRGDETVLDVGCGNGAITRQICKRLPRGTVLGIDNSCDMIALAENAYDGRYKNLSFKKADACKLKFKNKFDIIFSNASFHWIADHNSLLESIYRALRPGGKLVVQMGAKGNFRDMVRTGNKLIRKKKWSRFFVNFESPYHFYAAFVYRKLLKTVGFKINTMRTFDNFMEYYNVAEFKDSLRTIWMPYMHKVSADLREDFLDETVILYLKNYPPEKNGRIEVKMRRLEFQAQKPV